tara:strand:+ start:1564 stop:1878 length:315 start_codon:yes stop_codon:yes gene_type:complete
MGKQAETAAAVTAKVQLLVASSEQYQEGLIDLDDFLDTTIRVGADLVDTVANLTGSVEYQVIRLQRDKVREELNHYLSTTARLDEPEVIKVTMQGYHDRIKQLE